MTQINLTSADRAAIRQGIALGKVRKTAALKMAQMALSDPDRYAPLLEQAKLVLEPVLPAEQKREVA